MFFSFKPLTIQLTLHLSLAIAPHPPYNKYRSASINQSGLLIRLISRKWIEPEEIFMLAHRMWYISHKVEDPGWKVKIREGGLDGDIIHWRYRCDQFSVHIHGK